MSEGPSRGQGDDDEGSFWLKTVVSLPIGRATPRIAVQAADGDDEGRQPHEGDQATVHEAGAARIAPMAFAEFNAPVRDLLDRAGLLAAVGPDMIFDDLDDALRAFEATKGGPP